MKPREEPRECAAKTVELCQNQRDWGWKGLGQGITYASQDDSNGYL